MDSLLRIPERAALALHAMRQLAAAAPDARLSADRLAAELGAPAAHLAKVMQRLAAAGLVRSRRGPAGGFVLARPADEIPLLEILEATEGPLRTQLCALGTPKCDPSSCLLAGLLGEVHELVRESFSRNRLSDLVAVRPAGGKGGAKAASKGRGRR